MSIPNDDPGKGANGNSKANEGASGTESDGKWAERIKGKTPEEIALILAEKDKMIGKVQGENKNLREVVSKAEDYLEFDAEGNPISVKGEGNPPVKSGKGENDEVTENFRRKFEEDPITAILEVGAISNSNLIKNQINPLKSLLLEQNSGARLKTLAEEIKAKGIDLGDRPKEIMVENGLKNVKNGENIAIALAMFEKVQPSLEKGESLDKIKASPSPMGGGGEGASKGDPGSSQETFYDDFKKSLATNQRDPFDMT